VNDSYSEYKEHFGHQVLVDLYYSTKLYSGQKVEKINEIFDEKALEALRQKHVLEFCEENKNSFNQNEDVTFKIRVKNVSKITVNVFQINSESYYKKNKNEIPSNIELEGLVPAETQVLNLSDNPI